MHKLLSDKEAATFIVNSTRIIPLLILTLFVCLLGSGKAATIESNGVIYRSVSEIASKLGMKSKIDSRKGRQILSSNWTTIVFQNKSRVLTINSIKIYLGFSTIQKNNRLYIPELDWQFTLSPILIPPRLSSKRSKIRTIVLDPGHGGKDPGAYNPKEKLKEKELALYVAKELAHLLKKKGFRVYLTRKDDHFIELADRTHFAKQKKADLFVSIHFNSSKNPGASGIETYAYTLLNQPSTSRSKLGNGDKVFRRANRYDSQNVLLAYNFQKELLKNSKKKDRGLKRARFTVLENLQCPGALVELGFVNNPDTVPRLKSKKYLRQLAENLSNGILAYETRLKKNSKR